MLKTKKLMMVVMVVLAICLLAVMSFEVKATSDNPITLDDLNMTIDGNSTGTPNPNNTNGQIIQPNTNTNTNMENNTNGNTLPQTGVTEDLTVIFFIVVCVVSAIYAYKKIKDYNA